MERSAQWVPSMDEARHGQCQTCARTAPKPVTRTHTGNQAHLRRLQAKLGIGSAHDPLEQEADAAADRVMGAAEPEIAQAAPPILSRKCTACEEEEEKGPLQREAAAGGLAGATAPPIVEAVLGSPGRALDPATQEFMGSRFGTDFDAVRVHTDSEAARSAAAVGARAYTVGKDVVFGAGQYDPSSDAGRHLLAHELAHTIQQEDASSGLVQRDLATPLPDVAPAAQPDLTDAQIREAIRFNSQFYDAANTRLIQSILGGPVTGQWTADNIRAIAATQEQFGLKKDGKVGPDTFDFITREQTAEGAGTANADCLSAFRVITFPVQTNATAGPGGTTTIRGHHKVEARFSSRCDCSQFEYRQFIAGVATANRGGATQDLAGLFSHIPGGSLPIAMTEDGNTTCPDRNYGHRNQPGQAATTATCGEDHYTDTGGAANQASGCVYQGEDFPQINVAGLQTGDTVDVLVQFRGEIRRNGTVVSTRNFTDIDTNVVTP